MILPQTIIFDLSAFSNAFSSVREFGSEFAAQDEKTRKLDHLPRLQERYDPGKVFYSIDNRDLDKPGNLGDDYRALYEEFKTILKIAGVLRAQVKRNKGKVAQWQSYFLCDEFTIPVDGSIVVFRRVRGTSDEESQDPAKQKCSSTIQVAFCTPKGSHSP